jgi:hypothetical protein
MNFNINNEEPELNSIVLDSKDLAIWDMIKLGRDGGIINIGRYSIEYIKGNQKWGKVYLSINGKGVVRKQTFQSQKVVRDKETEKVLKEQIKTQGMEIKKLRKQLELQEARKQQKLQIADTVEEI